MKVNDLEESELRVYAHLHKLLSKNEMNDMYATIWHLAISTKTCFTVWENHGEYTAK